MQLTSASDSDTVTHEDESDSTSIRAEMADQVARLLAAGILAQKEFPKPEFLPRAAEIPLNNLGHQVVVDYGKMADVLWGTALGIRDFHEHSRGRMWLHRHSGKLGFVAAWVGSGVVGIFDVPGWMLVAVFLGIWGGVVGALNPNLDNEAADIKARNIKALLEGMVPPNSQGIDRNARVADWGSGEIGGVRAPVLVASEGDPFPGYGFLQAEQLFVCAPNDPQGDQPQAAEKLSEKIGAELEELLDSVGIAESSIGSVVTVSGRSLESDSTWLDKEGRPVLFCDIANTADHATRDPRASTRVYTAAQVLVPEHLMCATFFLRVFFAGDAAAVEGRTKHKMRVAEGKGRPSDRHEILRRAGSAGWVG